MFYFNNWGIWDYDFLYEISNDYWLSINLVWADIFIAYLITIPLIKFNLYFRKKLARAYFRQCYFVNPIREIVRKIIRTDDTDFLFVISILLLLLISTLMRLFNYWFEFFIIIQIFCLGLSIILWLKEYTNITFPILELVFINKNLDLNKLKRKNKTSHFYPLTILLLTIFMVGDTSNLLKFHLKLANIGGFNVRVNEKEYYLILKTKSFYYLYDSNNIIIQPTSKDELTYQRKSNGLKTH